MGAGAPTGPTVPVPEDIEDGVAFASGSARSALRHPIFRRVFLGAFLSQIGNWMQMVVLGALAYDLTESSSFVGLMVFAQLGPLLLFSMVGGVLADRIDRRRLLIAVAVTQMVLALALAGVVAADQPNKLALLGLTFGIGMGQAVYGPTYGALLPQLVPPRDLTGAISLNSTQMNASRVIGPVIGAFLDSLVGAPAVFAGNAVSFLFIIGALLMVQLPPPVVDRTASRGLRVLGDGFRIARRNLVVWRCLVVLFAFSLVSLPFVGQFPVLAERNLGIDERSTSYGLLYGCFGVGAVLGSLSIGTVFTQLAKPRIARVSLIGFAGSLTLFALLRAPGPAYPAAALVGFAYFTLITSLATILQEQLDNRVRGRVMALWLMGFGGTVPIGNLLAGPVIEWTSMTFVMLVGAIFAAGLAVYARLEPPSEHHTPARAAAVATAACAGR
jgi:predicted MFS family arabinose efflux permease